ncbi:MAG: hypothetical protein KC656_22280, partial [Myxococcales bacterium]|nr:hypothetical protein [Myxococcales bacterium]
MTSALPIAVVRTDRGLRSRAVLVGRTCRFVDSDDVPVGLAHAWERLKHVRDPAPTVLQDLVLVLRETVEARPRQAPLVKLPSPPVRGGRRDRPVDLTAAIADPRNTVHLLEALWSQGPAPHPSRFELPPDAPDATGPLPRGLRTDLLPLLRQATWPEVERMRGLAALLDLEAQEGRRAAVAALLVTLEVRETLAWLEALTSVPRAWVTPLLERMARSGRPPGSPELLADLALLAEEASGLWQLLENSRGLPDLDWLEAGVGWVYRGGAGEPDATFDAAVWREASRVLASAPWTLQAVWQEIPRRPG